jgi:hypothetical protein
MRRMHRRRLAAREVRTSLKGRGEVASHDGVNSTRLAMLDPKLAPWMAIGGGEPLAIPAPGRHAAEAA